MDTGVRNRKNDESCTYKSIKACYLGHDELVEINIVGQAHFARMNLENAALGCKIRHRKLYFAIDSSWAQQSGILRA